MQMFLWIIEVLILLWSILASSLGSIYADIPASKILSNFYSVTEGVRNICDEENNWWELTWGVNPGINGIRIGKHDTAQRNITWFSAALNDIQTGITTTTLYGDNIGNKDVSLIVNYLHSLIGSYCNKGSIPWQHLNKSTYASRCTVNKSYTKCPDKDDWDRIFMWLNWPKEMYMNTEPFSIEVKRKATKDTYKAIVSLSAAKQIIVISEMFLEEIGKDIRRTLKIPMLGLKALTTMKEEKLQKKTKTYNEFSLMNNVGKKILHIEETFITYNESAMDFDKFSFKVGSQDKIRKLAINYKFNLKNNSPKVQRKSLYTLVLTLKDFIYTGNETYNVWQTGQVERWKFINSYNLLTKTGGKIEQIYIYNNNNTGYEVAKIMFPFTNIAVTREWSALTDLKKAYFQFNPNTIVPQLELTYYSNPKTMSLHFKMPSPDYGISVNFSCTLDSHGVILWSVKNTNLWGGYENPFDILSGYVQHGSQHVLIVIKKNELFSPQYTSLLTYLKMLKDAFQENFKEGIYARLVDEMGRDEIENFIKIIKEIPTFQSLYKLVQQNSMIFDPKGWQTFTSGLYEKLQEYGKVEDTEDEFIIYYDLRNLPLTYILHYINVFVKNKV